MSLYCANCYRGRLGQAAPLSPGELCCPRCGRSDYIGCDVCGGLLPIGMPSCPRCVEVPLPRSEMLPPPRSEIAVVPSAMPALPDLLSVVPLVPRVPERYSGGRFGVEAEVVVPAGDVERMNELGQLVSLLHVLASRCAQFGLLTDHTRKLIRDMRVLATDAQEEIEMRRGSS